MEPDEAEDVRRLLTYAEFTAGGLMTSEPVILPADATVADALAHVRERRAEPGAGRDDLRLPAAAGDPDRPFHRRRRTSSGCCANRRPRWSPALCDTDLERLRPDDGLHAVSKYLATYNLVDAPVVDDEHRLIGAVTVDDVLDHVLPDDWRGTRSSEEVDGHARDDRSTDETPVDPAGRRPAGHPARAAPDDRARGARTTATPSADFAEGSPASSAPASSWST